MTIFTTSIYLYTYVSEYKSISFLSYVLNWNFSTKYASTRLLLNIIYFIEIPNQILAIIQSIRSKQASNDNYN